MKLAAYIFTVIVLGGALLSGACTPDPLDVNNVPQLKPHIVVSSQIIPGQSIAVLLTKSIGALDAGNSSNALDLLQEVVINDAVVTVHYGDKTDRLQFLGDGIYGTVSTPLIPNDTYTLDVTSPSMGHVSAKTQMNTAVAFDSVRVQLSYNGYDTTATVDYQFHDPPGKNWYMLNVQRFTSRRDPTEFLNPRVSTKLLTDDTFDGRAYRENYVVPFRRFNAGDTVAVFLANISEEYYRYLSARIDNRNSLSALVSDPLNLPSNVQGGFGYFNLHLPDVRVLTVK